MDINQHRVFQETFKSKSLEAWKSEVIPEVNEGCEPVLVKQVFREGSSECWISGLSGSNFYEKCLLEPGQPPPGQSQEQPQKHHDQQE